MRRRNKQEIIIATRQSKLALWQTHWVKQQLEKNNASVKITVLPLITTADQHTKVSLATIGGKDLFTKELQKAVLEKKADLAVHSLKDLSVITHPELILAAICKREDPRDVLLTTTYKRLNDLPDHAVIGTASPRRQCQLLANNSTFIIKLLRGNIESRIDKLQQREYDAIVLAAAGLKRLGLDGAVQEYFNPEEFVPAIGQGAIAIECRKEDIALQNLLNPLQHAPTTYCVNAERAVNYHLGGSCFTPIGAYATITKNTLTLNAMVGSLDGSEVLRAHVSGNPELAHEIGLEAAMQLTQQGAIRFLQ